MSPESEARARDASFVSADHSAGRLPVSPESPLRARVVSPVSVDHDAGRLPVSPELAARSRYVSPVSADHAEGRLPVRPANPAKERYCSPVSTDHSGGRLPVTPVSVPDPAIPRYNSVRLVTELSAADSVPDRVVAKFASIKRMGTPPLQVTPVQAAVHASLTSSHPVRGETPRWAASQLVKPWLNSYSAAE